MEFVELPELRANTIVIRLYDQFIKTFESKLNQLTLAKIFVVISKAYQGAFCLCTERYTDYVSCYVNTADSDAIGFLETAALKLQTAEGTIEPYLLVKAVIAQIKLKDKQNLDECKVLLESVQERLDGVAGVDPSVYSNFYSAQAEYHKVSFYSIQTRY